MPDKPYPVGHEGGEKLEPKQGHDHEGKPVDMGAPLEAKEMAEGLSKMLGGLPIEIVDKREERMLLDKEMMGMSEDNVAEPDDGDYAEERVEAREEAMSGLSKDDDLKDAFARIAGKSNEIKGILDAVSLGQRLCGGKGNWYKSGCCEECSDNRYDRLDALERLDNKLRGIALEIVTIASSRVTKLTPIEERLGVGGNQCEPTTNKEF